jgi:pyruvate/2-oxoglutarate dehydrogenase complex dihydrolipoamide dehydrogenase (E3) component
LDTYDLIAIGGGTAGLVAAAGGAGLGARVALIEQGRLGGECLWTGCVPSKALLAAARTVSVIRNADRFGITVSGHDIDFPRVLAWVRSAQERIARVDSPERFRALGVDVLEGSAVFAGARELDVNGKRIRGRNILIATGSRPDLPELPGLAGTTYHTNETIFAIDRLPSSLLVLGAGPIGLELAQAFARLGSQVTLVEESMQILPREDAELARTLAECVRAEGITLQLGVRALRVENRAGSVLLHLANGTTLHAGSLLVATGRRPNHEQLELQRAGVETNDRGVIVNERLRTTAPGVYAAGDITGAPQFTHVADYQARLVVRNALFPFSSRVSYAAVPWVTYSDPELAHVGLTEEEAREQHGDRIRVWRRAFDDVDRAIVDGETAGMVKLIATPRGQLLGGHVLGFGASNLIAQIALALRHNISLAKVAQTIHAYPTYSEAIRQAAEQQTRARLTGLSQRVVRWLARRS